jgi:hypothetical protein
LSFELGFFAKCETLMLVGLLWVVLAVAFEFLFRPLRYWAILESLGEGYDLSKGGLLQLGFVVLALSPLIAARLRVFRR